MDSYPTEPFIPKRLEANPQTRRQHRREFWWQVLFPILLIMLLVFGGAYLLLTGSPASIPSLAQISTMLLILPLVALGLVALFLVVMLIYALAVVMKWLPPNAFWLQKQIQHINHRAKQGADLASEPILRLDSWTTAARKTLRRYF